MAKTLSQQEQQATSAFVKGLTKTHTWQDNKNGTFTVVVTMADGSKQNGFTVTGSEKKIIDGLYTNAAASGFRDDVAFMRAIAVDQLAGGAVPTADAGIDAATKRATASLLIKENAFDGTPQTNPVKSAPVYADSIPKTVEEMYPHLNTELQKAGMKPNMIVVADANGNAVSVGPAQAPKAVLDIYQKASKDFIDKQRKSAATEALLHQSFTAPEASSTGLPAEMRVKSNTYVNSDGKTMTVNVSDLRPTSVKPGEMWYDTQGQLRDYGGGLVQTQVSTNTTGPVYDKTLHAYNPLAPQDKNGMGSWAATGRNNAVGGTELDAVLPTSVGTTENGKLVAKGVLEQIAAANKAQRNQGLVDHLNSVNRELMGEQARTLTLKDIMGAKQLDGSAGETQTSDAVDAAKRLVGVAAPVVGANGNTNPNVRFTESGHGVAVPVATATPGVSVSTGSVNYSTLPSYMDPSVNGQAKNETVSKGSVNYSTLPSYMDPAKNGQTASAPVAVVNVPAKDPAGTDAGAFGIDKATGTDYVAHDIKTVAIDPGNAKTFAPTQTQVTSKIVGPGTIALGGGTWESQGLLKPATAEQMDHAGMVTNDPNGKVGAIATGVVKNIEAMSNHSSTVTQKDPDVLMNAEGLKLQQEINADINRNAIKLGYDANSNTTIVIDQPDYKPVVTQEVAIPLTSASGATSETKVIAPTGGFVAANGGTATPGGAPIDYQQLYKSDGSYDWTAHNVLRAQGYTVNHPSDMTWQ